MPQTLPRRTFASEEQETQNVQEYSQDYIPVSYGLKRYEETKKFNHTRRASLEHKSERKDTWIYSLPSKIDDMDDSEAIKYIHERSSATCKIDSSALPPVLTDEDQYFETQAKLFEEKKVDLETKFNNKYVMFENGNVVFSGATRAIVAKQAYKKFGMRLLFIEKVGGESKCPEIYTPVFFTKSND